MVEVNNQIVSPVFPDRTFVITDYHDVEDTLYTNAINQAIAICSEQGGGKVVIPNGEFFTASIRLKSNVKSPFYLIVRFLKFTTDPFSFLILYRPYRRNRLLQYLSVDFMPMEKSNICHTGNGGDGWSG